MPFVFDDRKNNSAIAQRMKKCGCYHTSTSVDDSCRPSAAMEDHCQIFVEPASKDSNQTEEYKRPTCNPNFHCSSRQNNARNKGPPQRKPSYEELPDTVPIAEQNIESNPHQPSFSQPQHGRAEGGGGGGGLRNNPLRRYIGRTRSGETSRSSDKESAGSFAPPGRHMLVPAKEYPPIFKKEPSFRIGKLTGNTATKLKAFQHDAFIAIHPNVKKKKKELDFHQEAEHSCRTSTMTDSFCDGDDVLLEEQFDKQLVLDQLDEKLGHEHKHKDADDDLAEEHKGEQLNEAVASPVPTPAQPVPTLAPVAVAVKLTVEGVADDETTGFATPPTKADEATGGNNISDDRHKYDEQYDLMNQPRGLVGMELSFNFDEEQNTGHGEMMLPTRRGKHGNNPSSHKIAMLKKKFLVPPDSPLTPGSPCKKNKRILKVAAKDMIHGSSNPGVYPPTQTDKSGGHHWKHDRDQMKKAFREWWVSAGDQDENRNTCRTDRPCILPSHSYDGHDCDVVRGCDRPRRYSHTDDPIPCDSVPKLYDRRCRVKSKSSVDDRWSRGCASEETPGVRNVDIVRVGCNRHAPFERQSSDRWSSNASAGASSAKAGKNHLVVNTACKVKLVDAPPACKRRTQSPFPRRMVTSED